MSRQVPGELVRRSAPPFRCQVVMAAPSLPRRFRSHSGQAALLLLAPIRQRAPCLCLRPDLPWLRPASHFRLGHHPIFGFPRRPPTAPEVNKGKFRGAQVPRREWRSVVRSPIGPGPTGKLVSGYCPLLPTLNAGPRGSAGCRVLSALLCAVGPLGRLRGASGQGRAPSPAGSALSACVSPAAAELT